MITRQKRAGERQPLAIRDGALPGWPDQRPVAGAPVCETVVLTAAVNDDFGIQNPSGVSSDTVGGLSDWTLLIQKIS